MRGPPVPGGSRRKPVYASLGQRASQQTRNDEAKGGTTMELSTCPIILLTEAPGVRCIHEGCECGPGHMRVIYESGTATGYTVDCPPGEPLFTFLVPKGCEGPFLD